jgi:hypothetical protein
MLAPEELPMIDSPRRPARAQGALPFLVLAAIGAAAGACSATPTRAPTGSGDGGATSASASSGSTHASASGSTSGTGGAPDGCSIVCATEAQVTCPNTMPSACVAACEFAQAEVTWCTTVATAATACLAKEPASSFACDANGQTAATSGVCMSEQAAVVSCWDSGPPGGLPDLTQACTDACAKQAPLSCADPTCTADCESALMPGQKCNGAFAAGVACAAKQDAADFACDTETPPRANLKAGYCAFEAVLLGTCLQAQ